MSNLIQNQLEKSGQSVNKVYQLRWPTDTSKDYYFIHRDTGNTEPIMLEYGFVDSVGDDISQLKDDWEKLGDAVVAAILEYIGKPLTDGDYTVVSGDTLYKLAIRFNTTVDELKRMNNLTSNSLSIGQKLKIPQEESAQKGVYYVQQGDSLYSISQKYNTTIQELMELNNLSSTNLSIGQKLNIPTNQTSDEKYELYTIKSGDTLWNIAKKYNLPLSDLLALNNLSSNSMLSIGQVIKIPNEKKDIILEDNIIYTVQKGDTLWNIAKKYNVTVNQIMEINELTSNLLDIGQQLEIPTNENSTIQNYYVVKSGDSLWSIAQKYNTTVSNIKEKNNLMSNNLSIGQQLII